jgi:hypothetical protein
MTTLDATDPRGRTLRIEFVRSDDRFGHFISVVDPAGHARAVLESVEGTARDQWPASPPLQNLSVEQLAPDRRVALLVGMAGRSHWSASIEAVPGEAAFVFDVACRTSGNHAELGSLYRASEQDGGRCVVLAEQECSVNAAGQRQIAIVPAGDRGPGTIRWKYRIELARA